MLELVLHINTKKYLDILMILKKRIDESFSLSKGFREVYATRFRINDTTRGVDIVLSVRDYILWLFIKIDLKIATSLSPLKLT